MPKKSYAKLNITLIHNLKKKINELKESEERYRSLVFNIPGAVYRSKYDPKKWTIIYFSEIIKEIMGYPASDFIGDKVRTYESVIHLDDKKMVWEIVLRQVRKKQHFELEYRVICADGSIKWIRGF